MQSALPIAPPAPMSQPRHTSGFVFRAPLQNQENLPPTGEVVYLVDEDPGVREGLSETLRARGRQVKTFGTARAYLQCNRTDASACLILDMKLPDMSGLDLQRRLADGDSPPIIFMSGHIDIQATVCAMKAGAVEFLTKPVNLPVLQAAIDAAFTQDRLRRQQQAHLSALKERLALLTPREREVLPLIVEGFLNKQAAAILGISEVTLQVHRSQIMRKMAARSFAELVRMAEKLNIPVSS